MSTVYELMGRAGELPYGEARTLLVEEALRTAETGTDDLLTFRVRLELLTAYTQGGERAKAFTAFARCLSDYDRDPGGFDRSDEHLLLWAFKGTVKALTEFPEVPLDRTRAVLDDMERRFQLGGHGLQPVHMCRTVVAQHVGDTTGADDWYGRWHAAPRTVLSDCEGCDPGTMVGYLAWRGRDADALTLAEPVLQGRMTCIEQPQTILTQLLPIFLREGRLAEAADAHRRAYRVQRTRIGELWSISAHLEFCARTGNEARGLEILERHLDWLDRAPTPRDGMRFAAAGALVLRRLAETGHGSLTVRRGDTALPAAGLREELTAHVLDLASRFDARNGTSHQGDLVQGVLDAEPLVDYLPLTPHARRPAPARTAAEEQVEAADPDLLLDVAEEHWTRRESSAALAAWARFDALGAAPTTLRTARRMDGTGFALVLAGDPEAAAGEWRRAAGLYASVPDEERRQSALSRVGVLLCQLGEPGEGLVLLEVALTWLEAHALRRRRALSARFRLATAYTGTGRSGEALALLDEAAPDGVEDIADVELERARVLLQAGGREAEVEAALRLALTGYRQVGPAGPRAETALLLGQLLGAEPVEPSAESPGGSPAGSPAGSPGDELGELLTEAVVYAPADAPGLRAAAHAIRGGWQLSAGEAGQAVEDLIEAVAGFTAMGAYEQAANIRQDLSTAYLQSGRALEAAEAAEEAIPVLVELGDLEHARRCRYVLAEAQRELGETEAAAGTFTGLAHDERADNPGVAAQFFEAAGDLLSGLDKDALAAERFAAAADAFTVAGDRRGSVECRRRQAMCLHWSGRAEAGLVVMGTAREALSGLAADEPTLTWETALIDFDEARILVALRRRNDALARVEEAIAGFDRLGQHAAAEAARTLRTDILAT
ncbi:MAG: Tetratricopeptide 4 [Actinomycetia bacterium]|nr:Tetratricopeptide 4 [Actinomycetes bacterium]